MKGVAAMAAALSLGGLLASCGPSEAELIDAAQESVRRDLREGALTFTDTHVHGRVVCGMVGRTAVGAGYGAPRWFVVNLTENGEPALTRIGPEPERRTGEVTYTLPASEHWCQMVEDYRACQDRRRRDEAAIVGCMEDTTATPGHE